MHKMNLFIEKRINNDLDFRMFFDCLALLMSFYKLKANNRILVDIQKINNAWFDYAYNSLKKSYDFFPEEKYSNAKEERIKLIKLKYNELSQKSRDILVNETLEYQDLFNNFFALFEAKGSVKKKNIFVGFAMAYDYVEQE